MFYRQRDPGPVIVQPVSRVRRSATRFRSVLAGSCFCLLLLLPALDQWLGLSSSFQSTEKRTLSPRPVLQLPHVMTFVDQFNQYYKESFGGRNALFYAYSHWKLSVLGQSPLPEKVVVGKDGWFYPGNFFADVARQHQGLRPISRSMMQAIAARLSRYQQQLARRGARLYVMVAPDSHTIYPEHLPDNLQRTATSANLDALYQYLQQHTTVSVIDIRRPLLDAKAVRPVYYQTDTHWNEFGAVVASTALVNYLRHDYPTLPEARLSDYRFRPVTGVGGDLTTMLAVNDSYRDMVQYKVTSLTGAGARQTASIPNAEMNLPSSRFVGQQTSRPRLLFVGDSFSYSLNQYLPPYFSASFLVRSRHFNPQLVQAEQSDIVVIEVVERNLHMLADL
ncbi:alginate O-acetyltransferase AlgX-related protein [Spirosoma luteolum]